MLLASSSSSTKIAFFNAILPKSGRVRARIAVPGKRFIGSELLPIEEVISRIDDGLKVTASFATFEGWDHKKNKPGECDEHVAEETSRGIDLDGLASISHVEALQRAFPGAWVIWSNGITLAYRACGPWAQDCLLMARVGQEAARLTGLKYDSSCNIRKDGTPALHRGHLFRIGGVAEKRNGVTEYFGPIDAAATLVTDSLTLPEWIAPQQQVKNRQRQVRAAAVLDYQIEAKTGSETHKHAKCSAILGDRVRGCSMQETAIRNRTTTAHVQRVWQYPQKAHFNPGHNEYVGVTQCGMSIAGPTRNIQGRLHRYNDLWHGFADVYAIYKFSKEDMKENCITHHHLKGPIETYRKNFGIKTDEELQIAMNKEIDHHAEVFPENLNGEARPENEASPDCVAKVEEAIRSFGMREFTGAIIEAYCGGKWSRQHINNVIGSLPYITDNGRKGNAHMWIWEDAKMEQKIESTRMIHMGMSESIGIVERREGRPSFDPRSLPLPDYLLPKMDPTKKLAPAPWKDLDSEIASMLHKVHSVTNGPGGSGKTRFIEELVAKATGKVIVCAPSNAIAQNSRVRGVETIHTALKIKFDPDLQQTVSYADWTETKKRRIPIEWLIVDEASMVCKELLWAILKRADKNTKVVFVGDHRQLPPVSGEMGSYPFRDLISWTGKNDKLTTLTGNYRVQEGSEGLRQAIVDIDNGIAPKNGPGFRMLRLKEEQAGKLNDVAAKLLAGLRKKNKNWRAVSVLKGTEWGAQNISNIFAGGTEIKSGDEIVVAKTDRKHGVFKGQRGKVLRIEDRRQVNFLGEEIRWTSYTCLLKSPKSRKGKEKQLAFMHWADDFDHTVTLELKRDDFIRGSCQNTHAVQGEQDINWLVILENSRITTKEMFYVAVSRGMKNVIVLTVEGNVYKALSTSTPYKPAPWA